MEKSTGGHYPAINDANLKTLKIIIPPIEHQIFIVKQLEGIKSLLMAALSEYNLSNEFINNLLPSVLDRAFKGEL